MTFYRCVSQAKIMGTLLLLVTLVACSSPGLAPTPTPTPTPQSPLFVSFDLGLPAKALQAPVVGMLPGDSKMHVVITFKTNQSVLNQLKNQKVKSGQPTNLQDLANQIGISDATYQQIKAYIGVENATLKLDTLHTNVAIDATAGTFARLFQIHFVIHQFNGRTFFAPATAPKVPRFMADMIVAITGLDNYSQAPRSRMAFMTQPFAHSHPDNHSAPNCSPDPSLISPTQVAHAYGYDQFWAQGWQGQQMTVNFVELEGFDPRDIQNYFACVHFHGHLKTVNVDTPPPPTSGYGEATLDIETVAGLAPAINMVTYQTDLSSNASYSDFWTLFNDELTQIVNDNAKTNNPSVVSISWGGAEDGLTPGVIQAIGTNLRLLTQAEHMTVFVASGDCGAFDDGVYKTLTVDYPGTDPSSTDVGGTSLSVDAKGNRSSEVVWSDGSNTRQCTNQWGSGGGISQVFKQPQWSSVAGMHNSYSTGNRQVPDLAAVAFNLSDYVQGQWEFSGGTSAAAPIWAVGLSLLNQGLIAKKNGTFVYGTDTFYTAAHMSASTKRHPFNDVTRGNNLYYPATPGWDYTTGLGSPNLVDFFNILLAVV